MASCKVMDESAETLKILIFGVVLTGAAIFEAASTPGLSPPPQPIRLAASNTTHEASFFIRAG